MDKILSENFSLSVVGTSGGGKSFLIKYIVECFQNSARKFSYIAIISSTAGFNKDYNFLDKLNTRYKIYSVQNCDDIIYGLLKIQSENKNREPILLILDDVMKCININGKAINMLQMSARHYKINVILSYQYVNFNSTIGKEISKYAIIFNQKSENAKKNCYENYFNDFYPTYKDFKNNFHLNQYEFYFIDREHNTIKKMKAPG